MTTTAHRAPLEDLQRRAIQELATNPTISTYEIIDGHEVRRVNVRKAIQWAIDRTLETICALIGLDWDTIAHFHTEENHPCESC